MSKYLKRQVMYGGVLTFCLAGVAIAAGFAVVKAGFAVAALLTLAVYVVRSDEVERLLSYRAAAAAFVMALVGSIVVDQTGLQLAAGLPLWAHLMGAFLLSWVVLRIHLL